MFTAVIFIIVIGVLVLVHEWGHFVMARRAGMKVEEFGFGFPPRIFGIKRGGTLYSINWIPFGGFVKIFGENGDERNAAGSFTSKSFFARAKVIVAGVAMNFIFAVLLLTLGNFFGLRVGIFDDQLAAIARNKTIQVIEVAPDSPAAKGDIQLLDTIVGFKENSIIRPAADVKEVQQFISEHAGSKVDIVLKRGGETIVKEIEPRLNPPEGQGSLGVSLALTGVVSYPWYEAIWRGIYDSVIIVMNTVVGYGDLLKTLIISHHVTADVSGPIGIATITGQAARVGFSYLMQFVALISINLAVINIFPFPALDGGRLVLLIVEKFKGSPIKKEIEGGINAVGFTLLIALMIYVTIKDVLKFF